MADDETLSTIVTPIHGRVHIIFDDGEIASTLNALQVEETGRAPQVFVPLEAVHPGILEASETRKDEPGKGEAHYYNLKTLTADGPDQVDTDSFFKGRKVALFAVPGAYTGTCHKMHLPSIFLNAYAIKDKGVDTIGIISVNDAFVMNA